MTGVDPQREKIPCAEPISADPARRHPFGLGGCLFSDVKRPTAARRGGGGRVRRGKSFQHSSLFSYSPSTLLRCSIPSTAPWTRRPDLPTPLGKSPVSCRQCSPSQTFTDLLPSSASVSVLFARKMPILRLLRVPTRSQNQSPGLLHSCPLLCSV